MGDARERTEYDGTQLTGLMNRASSRKWLTHIVCETRRWLGVSTIFRIKYVYLDQIKL